MRVKEGYILICNGDSSYIHVVTKGPAKHETLVPEVIYYSSEAPRKKAFCETSEWPGCCKLLCNIKEVSGDILKLVEILKSPDLESRRYAYECIKNQLHEETLQVRLKGKT